MKLKSLLLASAVIGTCLLPQTLNAKDAADLRLYTIDCGNIKVKDANIMDTTDSYEGSLQLKASCYVIQHGDEYMLWDAGFNPEAIKSVTEDDMFQPKISETIPESLERIGLNVSDISKIGISHYHFDHIGQANTFKDAELYIGAEDFDALFGSEEAPEGLTPQFIDEWKDGKNVFKVTEKTDVFGDGSVMIIPSHGHTPGHESLLVNLKNSGPHILVGDLWHFQDNFKHDRMPDFNTSLEDTKHSMEEIKALAEEHKVKLIIQHDPEHFRAMPALPAYLD